MIVSRAMLLAALPPLDKAAIVFGRVDADAGLGDQTDGNRMAGFEHSKLLEFFGGL